MSDAPPLWPAGEYESPQVYNDEVQSNFVTRLRDVPNRAKKLVENLTEEKLETKYRNWTIRQIIHHIVDSHINSYVRFKWALTEDEPVIKAYDESLWSGLVDATSADLDSSLKLLDGLHHRWCDMIDGLSSEQMERGFFHPELDRVVKLVDALPMYVHHSDHHLAQVEWVIEKNGW